MINVIDSNNDFDELVETYEISEDEDYYSAENVIVKALKY